MRKRTGARGAGIVEYAMLVMALLVGGAAAKKAVGARVAALGDEASVIIGGGESSSSSNDSDANEVNGVNELPNTGSGGSLPPDATPEDYKKADVNHDGQLDEKEKELLATIVKARKDAEAQAAVQNQVDAQKHKANVEKKRHDAISSFINNLK